ncbi:mandelate racemase [Sulfurifustis variabilis]|uniref:Mandelate racemase n=1 Tax=Sulfurifustis variabilis TaxID=1675686 RepID=A0A1B4V787_9GAMM|nr:enolase C-terminal domain-like protein [Sulfurifustis variabilis]BAU49413.1 mandelate racemase [Sulfurifustis variabilis]
MKGTAPSFPDPLILRGVTTRAVRVPLKFALGTSAAIIKEVPFLLIDVLMEEGPVGHSYVFCYTTAGAKSIAAHIAEAAEMVKGRPGKPHSIFQMLMRRFALLGVAGPVRMALSALDVGIWDAAAVAVGRPLVELLGAVRRPIPAYDSRGLGLMGPEKLADEAEALATKGMKAMKLRLGYPTLAEDLGALRAVRRCVPRDVLVMVDYNQALTTAEAIRRGLALQQEGIAWLEEPIRHDDYWGNAEIARRLDVPLQIGENFNGPEAMAEAVTVRACDYVMPDVARIGGVTGWMQAAGIASAFGLEMSSHLVPELSVHLLAATPTAHWVEYVDWADAILDEPLEVVDGAVTPPDRPGLGITWSEEKLRRLETL